MPHMINDIHHLHKGGVAMLWVEGETCHIKFRSDGADTTIEFCTKIAKLQERAANIQQNNMQSFSGVWERNMMQSLFDWCASLNTRPVKYHDTDTKHIFASFHMTYTSKYFH